MPEKGPTLLVRTSAASARAARWRSLTAARVARAGRALFAARSYWLVPLALGLLLGRATVLGVMKPFGAAYVITLAALGQHARALSATAGAVAGGILAPRLDGGVEPWLVLLVAWCIVLAADRWFRLPPWVRALGALTGVASLRTVFAAFTGGDFVLASAATAAELAAVVVFFPFVRLWTERPATLSRAQLAALLTVLGLLVLGMENVYVYEYSLVDIFMRVLLLLAAAAGSLGTGAAAGAALGLLSVLSAGNLTWQATLLAPAGLLAGLGSQLGRSGALLGMLTVHILLSPYASDGVEIARALGSCILAGGLAALVPRRALRALSDALPEGRGPARAQGAEERPHGAETAAEDQLRRVAAVLEDAGRWLETPSGRPRAGGSVDSFEGFAAAVAENVCAGCPRFSVCWEAHVYNTYRDLMAFAASASGDRGAEALPEGLRQRCMYQERLVSGVRSLLAGGSGAGWGASRHGSDRDLAAAAADVYQAAARTYAGVAAILDAAADEAAKAARAAGQVNGFGAGRAGGRTSTAEAGRIGASGERAARFRLVVDVAQAAAGPVSGDCFRRVDLPGHRVALIVSDGMGTGPRAAAESEAAATLMARFLLEGFDPQFAVRAINAALALHVPHESFATLDVCLFDLAEGTVRMLKTGAAPTYVRRGRHVDVLRADSLPVGIWQGVEAWAVLYRLSPGDLVVMVTDGALETETVGEDKAAAAARALQRLEQPDPHAAVDELFKRVRPPAGRSLKDDVTIVAARLLPR